MTESTKERKLSSHPLSLDDKVIIGVIALAFLYLLYILLFGVH